jgi:hypothetical protein
LAWPTTISILLRSELREARNALICVKYSQSPAVNANQRQCGDQRDPGRGKSLNRLLIVAEKPTNKLSPCLATTIPNVTVMEPFAASIFQLGPPYQPKDQAEQDGYDERSHDRNVDAGVATLDDNVTGQASHSKALTDHPSQANSDQNDAN